MGTGRRGLAGGGWLRVLPHSARARCGEEGSWGPRTRED